MTASEPEDSDDDGLPIWAWILIGVGVLFVGLILVIILAAVIASFVLNLGGTVAEAPPTIEFQSEYADGSWTLIHSGGADVSGDALRIVVEDSNRGTWNQLAETGGTVDAGDQLTVSNVAEGDEIVVEYVENETATPLYRDTAGF